MHECAADTAEWNASPLQQLERKHEHGGTLSHMHKRLKKFRMHSRTANKTSDALIVDTFKNVFQRRSSEVFKPDVSEFRTIQKYMLHFQYSVTLCMCLHVVKNRQKFIL